MKRSLHKDELDGIKFSKNQLLIQGLRQFLPKEEPFNKELIKDFYLKKMELLSDDNLRVRVNRLKTQGVIVNVSRGWYKLNTKKRFEREVNPVLKKLSAKVKKGFPYLSHLLWSSSWLNEFVNLQLFRNVYVIEVEAGSEEAIFGSIKEIFPTRTFLNPKEDDWVNYIAEKDESIIIKTKISDSPKAISHGVSVAKLEKLLVDLYCDKLWHPIFSSEMDNIYTEACEGYVLNFSTLLSYAGRRGKRKEIWDYIKSLNVLDQATINLLEK